LAAVDLHWLPLGAGGHSVRWNGRAYEAVKARRERRPTMALFHAALIVDLDDETYAIEQAPAGDRDGAARRGVVAVGPVGTRWASRWRLFRYEVRVWPGGRIPDLSEAVDSPRHLSADGGVARRLLHAVARVPTPTWGRDELGTGEMWNSNAVIAWSLAAAGIDPSTVAPPPGGRAPGWNAGVVVAGRQPTSSASSRQGPMSQ